MKSTKLTRRQLLQRSHGQRVEVPDLLWLHVLWPFASNPAQTSIDDTVNTILETYSVTTTVEQKLKKANLSMHISSWYPYSTAADLESLTHFVCWMYVFDDAVIDNVSWPGKDNEKLFDEASKDLLLFVRTSLGLLDGQDSGSIAQPTSTNPAIDSFRGIGQVLCSRYSKAQRIRFLKSCETTLDGYKAEQKLRVSRKLPDWNQYRDYRRGSCCMLMCVAMIEFAANVHIPDEIMNSEAMQDLWDLTTLVSWLTNDIVSAKKELREGFIENAVALRSLDDGICQTGMNHVVDYLKSTVTNFEVAVVTLQHHVSVVMRRPDLDKDIETFIDGCRYICTGSLTWSLTTPRYGLADLPRDDKGNLVFIVGE